MPVRTVRTPRVRILRRLLRALAPALPAILAAVLAPPADAATGRWEPARVEGRTAAEAVTLVGRDGIAATRVTVYCTPFGEVAVSFARRPGMPAASGLALVLESDAGQRRIAGETNHYGVLVVEGAEARGVARLFVAARRDAEGVFEDGAPYGDITVRGAARAIVPVLDACGR